MRGNLTFMAGVAAVVIGAHAAKAQTSPSPHPTLAEWCRTEVHLNNHVAIEAIRRHLGANTVYEDAVGLFEKTGMPAFLMHVEGGLDSAEGTPVPEGYSMPEFSDDGLWGVAQPQVCVEGGYTQRALIYGFHAGQVVRAQAAHNTSKLPEEADIVLSGFTGADYLKWLDNQQQPE